MANVYSIQIQFKYSGIYGVVPQRSLDIMNIWWNRINIYDSPMEDVAIR